MLSVTMKDLPVVINALLILGFWVQSLGGLLQKGTLLAHHPVPQFTHLHSQGNWAVPTGALGKWFG